MIDAASPSFDPSLYTRAPVFSVSEGVALARALLGALPKGLPATVTKAADKLKLRIEAAQSALIDRQRQSGQMSPEDTRALDQEMDSAWSGLRQRLDGYASLPGESYPNARRAAELRTALFGSEG